MPDFRYEAIDSDGATRKGVVQADSLSTAAAEVESLGLSIVTIAREGRAEPPTPAVAPPAGLAPTVQRLLARREVFLPPLEAYTLEQPSRQRRAELRTIARVLRRGEPDEAVASVAANLPAWAPLLGAAGDDQPGSLFARFVENDQPLNVVKTRRLLAAAYPLFVICLLLAVLWPLSVLVIPTFEDIFNEFGLELPGATRMVVAFGSFFARGGGLLLIGLVILTVAGLITWPRWRPDWLKASLNHLGCWRRPDIADAARSTRLIADLVAGGLRCDDAVRASTPDSRLRPAMAFATGAELPPADRTALLRELSVAYAERTHRRASWVRGAVGPGAIVLLGVLVGFVVVALFLPLVRLIDGLT